MADEIKSVILDVQLDTGDSARKAAELRDEIIKLKEAQKENKRETQAQKDLYEATDASIKSHTERLNLLTQSIKNQETATKSNNGSFNQLQASLKVAESTLKNLTGTMKLNANGTVDLTQEYYDAKIQVDEAKKALLLFNAGISQGNLNVGNYGNTLEGMRAKLDLLRQTLQTTDVGSDAFEKLNTEIQETSFNLQVAEGKIDSMGERVAKNKMKDGFNDAQGAAQALTGAIGILSLAMGTDSKQGEILRNIMIGTTIAQTALTIAKSKDDIVSTALLVKTKLLTAGKWLYTGAVKGATAAQTAFNATLAGAAMAAFALMIKGLVDAWNNYRDAAKGATSQQEALNKARDEFAEKEKSEFQQRIEKFEKVNAVRLREIDLMEKQGVAEDIILQKRKDNAKQTLDLYNQMADEVTVSGDAWNYVQGKIADADYNLKMLNITIKENNIKDKTEKETKVLVDNVAAINKYVQDISDLYGGANVEYVDLLQERKDAFIQYLTDMGFIETEAGEKHMEYTEFITGEDIAALKKKLDDEAALLIQANEDKAEIITLFATYIGNIFGDSLTEAGLDLKKFSQGVAILLVETLEKALIAAQVQILAKEIASKSFAGIATSAILIGLITAASAGVKAALTQESQAEFYEGGYTGEGNPRDESNKLGKKNYIYHKDEYVVPSKVLNDPQGINLVEKLEQMRKNNPFRIGGIGKADGGFAYNFSNAIKQQQSISASDLAKIKLFVRVTDIDSGLKSIEANNSVKVL